LGGGECILKHSLHLGIKLDKGTKELYGTDGETTTQGMDDLDARCAQVPIK
jgi:fructose-bisphosphate aldolase class I